MYIRCAIIICTEVVQTLERKRMTYIMHHDTQTFNMRQASVVHLRANAFMEETFIERFAGREKKNKENKTSHGDEHLMAAEKMKSFKLNKRIRQLFNQWTN